MDDSVLTSPMYRDMIGASTSPMGMALGLGMPNPYCNTSFLGGATMYTGVTSDVYQSVRNEKYRNVTGLKKALVVLGSIVGGGFVLGRFRSLGKAIKSTNFYKKFFK